MKVHSVSCSGSTSDTQRVKKQTRQIYAAKHAGRHTRTIKLMEAN